MMPAMEPYPVGAWIAALWCLAGPAPQAPAGPPRCGSWTRLRGWWFVEIAGDADRAWSWFSDRRFTREGLGAAVRVGIRQQRNP